MVMIFADKMLSFLYWTVHETYLENLRQLPSMTTHDACNALQSNLLNSTSFKYAPYRKMFNDKHIFGCTKLEHLSVHSDFNGI